MILKGRSSTTRHVSRTHRVSHDWWFDLINLDPKIQIKYIYKTNSQTYWSTEKSHVISHVMTGIIFVVIQPFQFYQLVWSDVEKNAKRFRWRKCQSKIEANDEFSRAMQRKDSWRSCLYCMLKPEENQTWTSTTSENMEWAASKTFFRHLLVKLVRVKCWQDLVLSRVGMRWINGSKNRETCLWTTTRFVHRAHGQNLLLTPSQNQTCRSEKIILAQGEWSSAKHARPILKKCNARQ